MMIRLSRHELRTLVKLCDERRLADELVRDNEVDGASYSYIERCLANLEAEHMKSLSDKLLQVVNSDAKRVEIIH